MIAAESVHDVRLNRGVVVQYDREALMTEQRKVRGMFKSVK